MFTKTAAYYDAIYGFKDYKAACNKLHQLVQQHFPSARTLLDVACGTGKHLEYLVKNYLCAGLDLNADLLSVAKQRCPEASFYEGDMTVFDLGNTYDVVVCLFSSISYVQTVENLNKAVACMAKHLNPGGLLFVEPWFSKETYWVGRLTANFVDEPDLKIAWMYTSEIEGDTSVLDIHYMVGMPEGITEFTEHHVLGLWNDEQYRQAFRAAGIATMYDPQGLFGRGIYYGKKKSRS